MRGSRCRIASQYCKFASQYCKSAPPDEGTIMALIACKDCGVKFSAHAKRCPQCGAKSPYRWTRGKLVVAAVFVVVVAAGLLSGNDESSDGPSVEDAFAQGVCEKQILAQLKAPSTADFGDYKVLRRDNGAFVVLGIVDAENAFGAKLRSQYRCELLKRGDRQFTVASSQVLED